MENKVTLTADKLVVIPQGLTKITALKTKIAVPLAHVLGASIAIMASQRKARV